LPWQDFATVDAKDFRLVDVSPEQAALGALGLPGFTAYVGLKLLGSAPSGGRILISGAAGAVGSLAGQLARRAGWRVVGLASGRDRCGYLTSQLGFDAAVDRTSAHFDRDLAAQGEFAAYFDNVGGELIADAASCMASGGQILICGLMSQYNSDTGETASAALPKFLYAVMRQRLSIRSFATQQAKELEPDFLRECAPLFRAGLSFKDADRLAIERLCIDRHRTGPDGPFLQS